MFLGFGGWIRGNRLILTGLIKFGSVGVFLGFVGWIRGNRLFLTGFITFGSDYFSKVANSQSNFVDIDGF